MSRKTSLQGCRWVLLGLSLVLTGCVELPLLKAPDEVAPPTTKRVTPRTKPSAEQTVQQREASLLAAVDDENSIFFENGSTEIDAEGRAKLMRHVARLKSDDKLQLILVGQTGDQGSASYNLAIAERQADAVYRWLRAAGVPASQLRRYPVGAEKLGAACVSARCQQRMRRVELVYS